MYELKKGVEILYNGCVFDSLLELKFALLIEDKCSYLVHPFPIHYNQHNLNLIERSECNNKYTPDFLVRKWKDNTAFLIEIKPISYVLEDIVILKKQVAENYIKRKGYDWRDCKLNCVR